MTLRKKPVFISFSEYFTDGEDFWVQVMKQLNLFENIKTDR